MDFGQRAAKGNVAFAVEAFHAVVAPLGRHAAIARGIVVKQAGNRLAGGGGKGDSGDHRANIRIHQADVACMARFFNPAPSGAIHSAFRCASPARA
jgi:hypothetical protein